MNGAAKHEGTTSCFAINMFTAARVPSHSEISLVSFLCSFLIIPVSEMCQHVAALLYAVIDLKKTFVHGRAVHLECAMQRQQMPSERRRLTSQP